MQKLFKRAVIACALLVSISGCISQSYTDTLESNNSVHNEIKTKNSRDHFDSVIAITRPPIDLTPIKTVEEIKWLSGTAEVKVNGLPLIAVLNDMLEGKDVTVSFVDDAMHNIKVSMNIRGSRQQILDILKSKTGYDFTADKSTLTVSKFITETFVINLPSGEYSGQLGSQGQTSKESERVNGQYINVAYSNVNVFESLSNGVMALLKDDTSDDENDIIGSVNAISSLSSITVRTTAKRMGAVKQLINAHQTLLTKQVLLDIRILEFKSNIGSDQGIDWTAVKSTGEGMLKFSLPGSNTSIAGANSGFAFEATGDFDGTKLFINALEEQGSVSTQTPITFLALNSQPSRISQTTTTPYLSDISTQITDTSTTTTTERDEVIEGIDMMVSTNVKEDFVWLRISGKLSKISGETSVDVDTTKLRFIETRDVDINFTNRLRYGQTVVIGSIKQQTTSASKSASFGIDELGTQVTDNKTIETLVLLTPRKIK